MARECCCESKEGKNIVRCPVCGHEGEAVPKTTVESLAEVERLSDLDYYICTDEECEVVYYSESNIITHQQVSVPVWYKDYADKKILCYCSNVTDHDVDRLIQDNPNASAKEVIKMVYSNNECDCLHNNPKGKCCHQTVKEYIDLHYPK